MISNAALRRPQPPRPAPVRRQPSRPLRLQVAALGRWGGHGRQPPSGDGGKRLMDTDTSSLYSLDSADVGEPPPQRPAWRKRLGDQLGHISYDYYNWRRDTGSDLQLFVVLNAAVFAAGACIESLIRSFDETEAAPPEGRGLIYAAWDNLYRVLSVVLGQDLPPGQAGWPSQLFAVFVAIFGLASFALVLALVEQFVLEVLDSNVKKGSACYEQGHSVVLAWCESSRDVAQLTRILTQLCAANRAAGGGVVVVLTQQRGKLEMEQLFREAVPEDHRLGTRFVFRQGSPLDPAALKLVAASSASRIIVCSDYSRTAMDADAQVLRACVLLDELMQREHADGAGGPVIVAQVKTEDAMPLMHYACSQRVIPVPTNKINARRYVRLLHNPIATVFSRNLMDHYSPASCYVDTVPEVQGCTFSQLPPRFPDAIVAGLQNQATGYCQLNPPPDRVVEPGDALVTLRPGSRGPGRYHAVPTGAPVDLGAWDPDRYVMKSTDEQPLGAEPPYDNTLAISARASRLAAAASAATNGPNGDTPHALWLEQSSRRALFVLPIQYSNPLVAADELLICGWMGQTFMWELMAELDHSDQGLTFGSRVTLFNCHDWPAGHLEQRLQQFGICSLQVQHVRGDPRSRSEMQRLISVAKFKAAIVVCDSTWADAEATDTDGGLRLLSQAEMLSLDAAMLMVQLNIRLLLEEANHPTISILCEKLTYLGTTRFEDDQQAPLGLVVNSASYAAKALTKVSVEPRFLCAYLQLGVESDLLVQDSSAFAGLGEELSYLQLQARAASVRQVMMGYYMLPGSATEPLELVVNPQGEEERSKVRVWNSGDWRCKLVTLATKKFTQHAAEAYNASHGTTFAGSFASSLGSMEETQAVADRQPRACDACRHEAPRPGAGGA